MADDPRTHEDRVFDGDPAIAAPAWYRWGGGCSGNLRDDTRLDRALDGLWRSKLAGALVALAGLAVGAISRRLVFPYLCILVVLLSAIVLRRRLHHRG